MRGSKVAFVLSLSALAAAVVALPCAAFARPELAFQLGRTFAVGSRLPDAYNQGGFNLSGGVLWPWENRFRFGVVWFASDLGSQLRHVTLVDSTGSKNYGSIETGHLGTWGAAWRVDALGPRLGSLGRGYATASYGYFRFNHDHVGRLQDAVSAVGGSLDLGIERTLTPHHTLGLAAGATWMSDDFTRRYGTASLEWRWRW